MSYGLQYWVLRHCDAQRSYSGAHGTNRNASVSMIYARVPRDVASPCKTASTLRSPHWCHSASDRLAGAFITAHTRTHPTEFTIPANDAPHRTLRDHKQRYLIALPSSTCSTMLALPKQHTASVLHSTIHCLPITISATRHICAPLASGSPFALRPAAASTPSVARVPRCPRSHCCV